MNYTFKCPDEKKIRVIIDTDAKNEVDDQFAIVHQILSPRLDIKGYIAAHFELRATEGKRESMQKSYDELIKLLDLMNMKGFYPILHGANHPMPDEKTPVMSEGAEFIIKEAMKEDKRPLFICFLGTLTDLAAAYLAEPRIAGKFTVVWIGGGEYPVGEREFNLMQDINAANVLMCSELPLWQIPINAYRYMKFSMAELQHKVKPHGKIGKYLFKQMLEWHYQNAKDGDRLSDKYDTLNYAFTNFPLESWVLGDQPTVTVLLDSHQCLYDVIPAPRISRDMFYIHGQQNRPIRVYNYVDNYMTFEDFFAKLALNFPDKTY
jgi:inosine-uridine nucleoside N-ribohydrolase